MFKCDYLYITELNKKIFLYRKDTKKRKIFIY